MRLEGLNLNIYILFDLKGKDEKFDGGFDQKCFPANLEIDIRLSPSFVTTNKSRVYIMIEIMHSNILFVTHC